jgi:hypothetical protein
VGTSTYLFGAVCPDHAAGARYRPVTAKPRSFTSKRSPPRLHRAPIPFSFSIKPAGTVPRNSGFRTASPYCRCRRAHPNSTAKGTSGSSCVRTGCQTAFSNHSTTPSITAATLGTHLSANRGRSCPTRLGDRRSPIVRIGISDYLVSLAGTEKGSSVPLCRRLYHRENVNPHERPVPSRCPGRKEP